MYLCLCIYRAIDTLLSIRAFFFYCMSLQETKMAVMNLAFFFFFTLYTLLGAYNARHLHGIQLIDPFFEFIASLLN